MDIKRIKEVIKLLKQGSEKPGRYFIDFSHCVGLAEGIKWSCYEFNIVSQETHYKLHKDVAKELGWEYLANSPAMLIKATNWDEEKKIVEFLKIEITVWERIIQLGNEMDDVKD